MKRFIIAIAVACVAIFITESVMAQQSIRPSKREIKETINTMSENAILLAKQHKPVSLNKHMNSFYDWAKNLDESCHKYTAKQLIKWKKEHKEIISEYKDYMNICEHIAGDEQFDFYSAQSVVNVYFDMIYEHIEDGNIATALESYLDFTTFVFYRNATGEMEDYAKN